MKIQLFKKNAKQQSANGISVSNLISSATASSFKALRKEIGIENRPFYNATTKQFRDLGNGIYMAASYTNQTGNTAYVFAFVHSTFSEAIIVHKPFGNKYVEMNFRTEQRTDKNWIFEINTAYSSQETETKAEDDLMNLSKEELIALLMDSKKELVQAQETIENLNVELAAVQAKSDKHFALKVKQHGIADFTRKKYNALVNIIVSGGDVANMIKAESQLNFLAENNLDMKYYESIDAIDAMLNESETETKALELELELEAIESVMNFVSSVSETETKTLIERMIEKAA